MGDEFLVSFTGPGVGTDWVMAEQNFPAIVSIPLTQQLPVSSITVRCTNEITDCGAFTVNLVGDVTSP